MSNYNTILIKRRGPGGGIGAPASLSGGELAFNEASKTLYYGISGGAGVIPIAGEGAFITLDTVQNISGAKTFTNTTTFSSITVSSDSVVDLGLNRITNLGEPVDVKDATTLGYVDTEIDTLSANFQQQIDNLGAGTNTAVESLSTEVYNTFVKLTDDRAVQLDGGLTVSNGIDADSITTTGSIEVGSNLTVTGNLSVLGTQVVVNTQTINISGTSTQIDILNNGTDTGLIVNQTGEQDVAEFKDDGNTALIIKGNSTTPGYVGIGTSTPNEKLTVVGNVSATGTIYSDSGLEISGGGATTLYVESGLVGINTEAPNEELTVVGSISATEDIFARNGDFTGTMDIDGATTLGSTLDVTGASTFSGAVTINNTLSTTGAVDFDSTLDVVGATTLGSTLNVTGASTLNSTLDVTGATTFASTVSAQGAVTVDGVTVINNTLNVTGAVDFDSTLNVDGTSTFVGNISASANIVGVAETSYLVDFIVDGGVF